MSVPLYDLVTPNTGRGLTASLWQQSLQRYVSNDPRYGIRIQDDFTATRTNTTDASHELNWFLQDANAGGTSESFISGAAADGTAAVPDGVAILSVTTGTDEHGIEVHYGATSTTQGIIALPTHSTDPRGRVVYETRVDLNVVDQFFIGLTEPIVEFLSATSTLPTNSDYIGFYRLDGGILQFVTGNDNNGGTAVIDSANLITAAAMDTLEAGDDNFFKMGFAVNDDDTVDIVVNGVWYGTLAKTINSLALPIELLTPKYAITRGTTGNLATLDLPIDTLDVFVQGTTQ